MNDRDSEQVQLDALAAIVADRISARFDRLEEKLDGILRDASSRAEAVARLDEQVKAAAEKCDARGTSAASRIARMEKGILAAMVIVIAGAWALVWDSVTGKK